MPGCAILEFPGNPPSIPQKYPKVVFDGFLHVFGKMLPNLFFFSTLRWHKLDFFELIVAILLFLLGQAR